MYNPGNACMNQDPIIAALYVSQILNWDVFERGKKRDAADVDGIHGGKGLNRQLGTGVSLWMAYMYAVFSWESRGGAVHCSKCPIWHLLVWVCLLLLPPHSSDNFRCLKNSVGLKWVTETHVTVLKWDHYPSKKWLFLETKLSWIDSAFRTPPFMIVPICFS